MSAPALPGRWWERAACAGLDTSLWFPPAGQGGETAAVRICGTCPVRAACLDDAMRTEGSIHRTARHGIWGGVTTGGRERLYRRGWPQAPADDQDAQVAA